MLKSYRYRLYPNASQEALLARHLGSARWIYNWALAAKKAAYESDGTNLSWYDLVRRITGLKTEEGTAWLSATPIQVLQQSVLNLEKAYSKFFKEKKGFPNFKKRGCGTESVFYNRNFRVDSGIRKTQVPKIGLIKTTVDRCPIGTQKSMAISREPTGKWFVSVLCEDGISVPEKKSYPDESNVVGIDLGIKDFAVLSTGERIANPKFAKDLSKRLAVLQRRAARKEKDSANRRKANLATAKCHERIRNRRKHFLSVLSSRIVSEHDCVALETLSPSNMVRNRRLAGAISDASWSKFVRMLEYKAERSWVRILRIGRFEPSSKTCSCGTKNQGLKLSDRDWTCPECSATNDRDLLAASNIKKFALRDFYGSQ